MEKAKARITFSSVFSLTKWAITFWMKNDFWGFWLYALTEVYDSLESVFSSFVVGYILAALLTFATSGGDLLTLLTKPLLAYTILYFTSFTFSQVNRVSNIRRQVNLGSVLERLYAEKITQLSLNDMDSRGFANRFELAKESKVNLPTKLSNFVSLIRNPVVAIMVMIPLLVQGYWYVVIAVLLFSLPAAFANARKTQRRLQYRLSQVEKVRKTKEVIASFQNTSDMGKEIKIHQADSLFYSKGVEEQRLFDREFLKFEQEWFTQRLFPTFLESLLFVGFLYKYIINAAAGLVSFSGVVPFLSILQKFRTSVVNSVQQYTIISESLEDVIRVKDFLEYTPTRYFSEDGQLLDDLAPSIKVDSLTFAYPELEKNIYENLSLEIKAGEKVAIVGENGVGKTTLLKLIIGMYKPRKGSIQINNQPLFSYTSESFYTRLGTLFQSFPTYAALSLRENVAVGRYSSQVNDEKVIKALKLADAWDFSQKYPLGLDTILSHKYKDGISPSTGQWQKIAIARLFYRNPSLVIFDEPTSSIDAESEYKIFNEIFEFFKEKTVIIVSHRFSTVRQADRIIVLKEGVIVEQGKHDELLSLRGVYASAYAKQAEGYK